MKLKLAEDLAFPLDIVTQTIAVIAKRRAGKSYTMRRLSEQLAHAGQQIVIVDPKGDQWGLRSSADGKSAGLPIVILGGERGDVPLESTAGEVVAKLVVEERVSALLDLSLFRKHELATFMAMFLETLYRLKAREEYRTPMMLVIDEADAVAPQKPQRGEERMLGAAEDIVRRGGQRGIGCVLVTQRSAVLNKNVLTQAQILIALRTIAPQDLAAMNAWIDVHGTLEQKKTLMASLPALPVGDAWVWSPGWPTTDGIFKRVHILPIETFDSGASPKPGAKPVEPKKAADVDLEALTRQMSATIEKAKADDPKALRRQLAEATREIEAIRKLHSMPDKPTAGKPIPMLTDADRELLQSVRDEFLIFSENIAAKADIMLRRVAEHATAAIDEASQRWVADIDKRRGLFLERLEKTRVQKILEKLQAVSAPPNLTPRGAVGVPAVLTVAVRPVPARRPGRSSDGARPADGASLPPGEHATLTAALQYPDGLDRKRLGILTGYKRSSRDAYIARLTAKGLIEVQGTHLYPTETGRAALNGSFEPLPTGAALVDYWRAKLPDGERKTLDIALAHPGQDVARETIDAQTGYKRSSRDAYLTRLKARGLVEFSGRGTIRASAELFS